ncbi:MAG: response regulator [Bacteroidota bacterium]
MGLNTYGRLILYAEDSQLEQELFREALKESEYSFEVKFFNNGESLVEYLQLSEDNPDSFPPPAIIMLDWQMPVKSGLETLKQIKSHKDWKTIPVLIFSSHDDPEIIQIAYQAHANAYIKKPLGFDDLPRILASIDDFWIKRVKLSYKNPDL